jgi:macrodomain Ter protein organizer (MatP/YcbG family)|tara:strand:- start:1175 stop:1339 length:165 start_codon:yes stop_codon:yes gene_type:complete
MENDSKKATNEAIARNLVDSIAKLLEARNVRYFSCSDLRTEHKKIEIEYDYKEK